MDQRHVVGAENALNRCNAGLWPSLLARGWFSGSRRKRMALPKPPYCSRAYVYRRSRRGTLYVQRCTIKPSSSWQDARRKTPNDLFLAPLSLSLSLSLFLLSCLFLSFTLPFLLSVLFHQSCLLRLYLLSILSPSSFRLHIYTLYGSI